jgi:uncharacterized protein
MTPRPLSPAILGLFIALWTPAGFAQDLPAAPEGHVLDLSEVLDPTSEARIERILAETEAATGVEMEVVALPDIARHGGTGERLEDYAARLLTAWETGSTERNDGILILVATGSAEARIALGSGYPAVYEKRAARVLSTAMLPALLEGRVAEGVEAGVVSARDQLVAPFLAGATVTATEGFETAMPDLPPWLPVLLLALGAAGIVGWLVAGAARKRKTCPRCGEMTLARTFEVIDPPAGSSPGSGIEHRLCDSCGFTDRQVFLLRRGLVGGYRRKPVK